MEKDTGVEMEIISKQKGKTGAEIAVETRCFKITAEQFYRCIENMRRYDLTRTITVIENVQKKLKEMLAEKKRAEARRKLVQPECKKEKLSTPLIRIDRQQPEQTALKEAERSQEVETSKDRSQTKPRLADTRGKIPQEKKCAEMQSKETAPKTKPVDDENVEILLLQDDITFSTPTSDEPSPKRARMETKECQGTNKAEESNATCIQIIDQQPNTTVTGNKVKEITEKYEREMNHLRQKIAEVHRRNKERHADRAMSWKGRSANGSLENFRYTGLEDKKCYNCQKFGHISKQCHEPYTEATKQALALAERGDNRGHREERPQCKSMQIKNPRKEERYTKSCISSKKRLFNHLKDIKKTRDKRSKLISQLIAALEESSSSEMSSDSGSVSSGSVSRSRSPSCEKSPARARG